MFHASSTKILTGFAASAAACVGLLSIAAPASADVKPDGGPSQYIPAGEVPIVEERNGLDTSSVALGALGGIAFAGAGLGITLGVQRRRDHSALHST
ncbi:hypothetical protein EV643_13417 [Kribbella sp. VKM Ac-2527]|uniref:LPXTG-motif cell wall-anchored protein n=1 Tax=Kribbella caucasensis TaxID=2512215 RepID=A0A4R6J691_9ACTN|nr:hypothetical protein [Kribbella sp. VKM Ac-2527]TDO30993.1 hypothetical protein EV643_13417 [Kribbella sp. VKM Ac-2527]